MNSIWISFASILTLNAIAALSIAYLLSRKHPAPGLKDMSRMFLALAVWAFFYAVTAITADPEIKHLWLRLENLGIASVPVFWFFFVVRYTKQDKWLSRPFAALFWVIPAITWIFLFSERWFYLYYTSTTPFDGAYGPLVITRGPWYMVQLVQTYALLASATMILIWRLIQYRNIYRRQMVVILGALAIPWLVNALYQSGPDWLPPIDLTPISFTLSALLISVSVFRMELFDLVPIARHLVMDQIPELVLVVDANDRVLDANHMAGKWLQKPEDEIIGNNIVEVLNQWPQLVERFKHAIELRDEIQISGESLRSLEVNISPLYSPFNLLEGRVFMAHDITERRKMEDKLKRANRSLKEQLDQIERLQGELRDQAIRDPLTGVFNRRYLAETLDQEMTRAERKGYPISIIAMDIDHFKQFNDTYGHKCGDLVLQSLGRLLAERCRQSDIVCRYGGEEFVVLMPEIDFGTALSRAEDLRAAFENSVLDYEDEKLRATFSAGVASFPQHGENGDMILQAADRALYQSKADGRNRVTAYRLEKHK
jgi:diguanylate cyclase (GGDEF)-like protein/PAS domain S-box-containing protein